MPRKWCRDCGGRLWPWRQWSRNPRLCRSCQKDYEIYLQDRSPSKPVLDWTLMVAGAVGTVVFAAVWLSAVGLLVSALVFAGGVADRLGKWL